MKKILTLLALSASSCAFADADAIGHMYVGKDELEFYSTPSGCIVPLGERKETGGLRMSRYPQGDRSAYVMGCWKPVDGDRLRAVFEDGLVLILNRKQLIPTGQEASRFNL